MVQLDNRDILTRGPHRLPDFGAEWGDLESWRNHFFRQEDNTYRERHMERMSVALHYSLGNQDIEFTPNARTTDTGYAFYNRNFRDDEDYPRPVTNYIGEAFRAESAALGKRKLVGKVVPSDNDPQTEISARKSTDILHDHLKRLGWSEQRKLGLVYFINCGSITYKTYWDESYSDTKVVGSPEAMACPDCGTQVSSPFINTEQRNKLPNVPNMGAPAAPERGEDTFMLTACPECPDGVLEPYQPSPEDLEQDDQFGNPMSQEVPKGAVGLELYTPFQEFVQNNGVGVTPHTAKLKGYIAARSMDWLIEHYPQLVEDEPGVGRRVVVDPDPADHLMEHHELLGEAALRYSYAIGVGDPNVFDDHKLVYEIVQEKSYRFPKGRYCVLIKDYNQPLEDGPLYIDVTGPNGEKIEVPKVKFHTARYQIRAGEWWGKGMPDDMISSQNVFNSVDSMAVDSFERMGFPSLAHADSLNLQGPEWWDGNGAGRHYKYEVDPVNPQLKPEVIEGRGPASALFSFRESKKEDLKTLGAPKDVEIGEAPRNITTTTGLQLLSEQADRLRADAEDALVNIYEDMWKHMLDLLWAFRLEEDQDFYEVETPSGAWEKHQITNTLIAGQTKVKIEKQAYVDKSVFWKEAVREAQLDGLYDPDSNLSPSIRIKLLEARGLPTEMVESENLQVKSARRQWIDFRNEGLIPTIDETLDNPHIHFEELGNLLLQPDAQDMAEAAGWPEIAKRLSGWRHAFQPALDADTAAREFYGGWQPPEVAEQMYMDAQMQHQEQVAQHQAVQVEAAQMVVADDQTPAPQGYLEPPPEPPPPPQFLPDAMEDKISAVWTQILNNQSEGIDPATGQPQPKPLPEPNYPELIDPNDPLGGKEAASVKQQDFLRFRAVFEAYKVLAEQDNEAQMLGELQTPAPSSQPEAGGERPSPFSKPQTPPTGGVKV